MSDYTPEQLGAVDTATLLEGLHISYQNEVHEFNALNNELTRLGHEHEADQREIKALKEQLAKERENVAILNQAVSAASNNIDAHQRMQAKLSQVELQLTAEKKKNKELNALNPKRLNEKVKRLQKSNDTKQSTIEQQKNTLKQYRLEIAEHEKTTQNQAKQIKSLNLSTVWSHKKDKLAIVPERMKTFDVETGKRSESVALLYLNEYSFGCLVFISDDNEVAFNIPPGVTDPEGNPWVVEEETIEFARNWLIKVKSQGWRYEERDLLAVNPTE